MSETTLRNARYPPDGTHLRFLRIGQSLRTLGALLIMEYSILTCRPASIVV
jgi:hypothetical protein